MSNFSNKFPSTSFLTPVVTIYSLNSYFDSIAKMQGLYKLVKKIQYSFCYKSLSIAF